jgi:hypothetical protein
MNLKHCSENSIWEVLNVADNWAVVQRQGAAVPTVIQGLSWVKGICRPKHKFYCTLARNKANRKIYLLSFLSVKARTEAIAQYTTQNWEILGEGL